MCVCMYVCMYIYICQFVHLSPFSICYLYIHSDICDYHGVIKMLISLFRYHHCIETTMKGSLFGAQNDHVYLILTFYGGGRTYLKAGSLLLIFVSYLPHLIILHLYSHLSIYGAVASVSFLVAANCLACSCSHCSLFGHCFLFDFFRFLWSLCCPVPFISSMITLFSCHLTRLHFVYFFYSIISIHPPI